VKDSGSIISASPPAADFDGLPDDEPDIEWRQFAVPQDMHGERLDRALVAAVPEFSRSYLQQLVADGAVIVNGSVVHKPSARIRALDLCRIALRPTPQSRAFVAEAMPLVIVHEDDDLLVINKPAGLVVHPAPGHWSGTLLNGLLAYHPGQGDVPRAGIVHRLDKDTSGLMLVARTRRAMDALVHMIAARTVQRRYLALAHRVWTDAALLEVTTPIGRDPANRLRMAVVDLARHSGKPAHTSLELLENAGAGCLIRATLHTGRTHQIRVHMASIGHPLVADVVYGGMPGAGMQRQALHAKTLALPHPVTGVQLEFVASEPPDMVAALKAWGLGYNLL
jgi:23S rRNA pseudouridine1911/1915/1917 synthase